MPGKYEHLKTEDDLTTFRYHFFTKKASHQADRFASLAVTVLVELGINRKPRAIITRHEMIVGLPPGSILTNRTPPAKFWNHDERRAFIGTYIISTLYVYQPSDSRHHTNEGCSCSILYRKQSPLIHTQYLDDCALSLYDDNCNPSDLRLIHYIQLLRIASDVYKALDYDGKDDEQEMSDDKVYALVKTLERQLAKWRLNLPIAFSEDG